MANSRAHYVIDVSDVRYCSLDVPSPQHPQNVERQSEAATPSRKCQCMSMCYFLYNGQRRTNATTPGCVKKLHKAPLKERVFFVFLRSFFLHTHK